MDKEKILALALSAVLVSGCSSRPRQFVPQLAVQPVDGAQYEMQLASCQSEADELGAKRSGKLASAGAGAAGGAGAAVIGSAATSGTYSSFGAAAAAGGAVIVAVPVIGLAAAWGIARSNRARKEKRIKEAATRCLSAHGYEVAGWNRVKRQRKVDQTAEADAVETLARN